MRPFGVFDIDGTLIRWQLYHATADALVRMGHFDKSLFDEVKQARSLWKKRAALQSFSDYEEKLVKTYASVLSNITVQQFEEAVDVVFEEYKDQVYRYTRELIKELKAKNYLLFAISGSQTEIVSKIADYYGFDDCIGSDFERKANKFSGKVVSHRLSKHVILDSLVKKHNATYKGSYAVGDSESDISMLEAAENPIAFNPTKGLFEAAKEKGWKIAVERKNVVYELESRDGHFILA